MDLTLEDGDFVTVIGGNGAGKSTMLNLIAGVFPVDSGKIILNGLNLNGLPEHKRARFLGRVFQDPMRGTAATMGIEENLALPIAAASGAAWAMASRVRSARCTAKNSSRLTLAWRTV